MGRHSDFHQVTMGFPPLPLLMNTCPQCGFSGTASTFDTPETIPSSFKQQIIEHIQPIVTSQPLTAGRRYELFALQKELLGASAQEMGDYYLRASWAARDEGDDHEANYQHYALTFFHKALSSDDEPVNEADEAPITYLVGELYRRTGDLDEAERWFARVLERAEKDESWARFAELAQRQRDTPQNMM